MALVIEHAFTGTEQAATCYRHDTIDVDVFHLPGQRSIVQHIHTIVHSQIHAVARQTNVIERHLVPQLRRQARQRSEPVANVTVLIDGTTVVEGNDTGRVGNNMDDTPTKMSIGSIVIQAVVPDHRTVIAAYACHG